MESELHSTLNKDKNNLKKSSALAGSAVKNDKSYLPVESDKDTPFDKQPLNTDQLFEAIKKYNKNANFSLIEKAFKCMVSAHKGQKRISGEPYALHPLAVACILASKRLDTASIVTGLLHDTVEDTSIDLPTIKKIFGEEISKLVDGVTKLGSYQYRIADVKHAENYRKLLLAASGDIRVLLIKLADRLHNMKSIKYLKDDRQKAKSEETLEIYAPIASRIGFNDWQQELEENSFEILYPEIWAALNKHRQHLNLKSSKDSSNIAAIVEKLYALTNAKKLDATISGREKSLYSIWRKMRNKNLNFESLTDIYAFRIIVDNVSDCYKALGYLHEKYSMISGKFKDYISVPKPNGYKSIHTSVITDNHRIIEVQIRTHEMNTEAELGIAAHWHYKEKGSAKINVFDGRRFAWLKHLLSVLEDSDNVHELIENTRLEMYAESVFVFTPQGELITLPQNATLLDFAYSVHTHIGHHCAGAKVNGQIRPLKSTLENGEMVEILLSKKQEPKPEWEHYCITGKARAAIRRYLRSKSRDHFINLGRKILEKKFADYSCEISDEILKKAIKSLNLQKQDKDNILQKVGEGSISANSILFASYPKLAENAKKGISLQENNQPTTQRKSPEGDIGLAINGLIDEMAMSMGKCCNPLPGDNIIGIITTGKGVTIHRRDCDNLQNFISSPERWITLRWDAEVLSDGQKFIGQVYIVMENSKGAIAEITGTIASKEANISNFQIIKRDHDFFEILIDVEVSDLGHLNSLINTLSNLKSVNQISRSKF